MIIRSSGIVCVYEYAYMCVYACVRKCAYECACMCVFCGTSALLE